MAPQTNLPIIFGAMTFGRPGEEQVRTSNLSDCTAILDSFQSHGHTEIDTSRFYGGGTSEEYLGTLKYQERNLVMHTKYFPNTAGYFGRPKSHLTLGDMREALETSLKALGAESVDLWYLHAPDREVRVEETLEAVDVLFKEGKFRRWGVSNFMAWEVSQICELCLKNNYPLPSVYQGPYNALYRTIEHELLPCLRKYNMSFYAFNPLAGGWLTSRYHRDTSDLSIEPGSRFDANRLQGRMYRARFWNEEFFTALDGLRDALREEGSGITEAEAALRWMMHHSKLDRERGDKVIIGASSVQQLEMNLENFEKGALPDKILEAFNRGWNVTRGVTWKYFH